jgi:hypothetical protein
VPTHSMFEKMQRGTGGGMEREYEWAVWHCEHDLSKWNSQAEPPLSAVPGPFGSPTASASSSPALSLISTVSSSTASALCGFGSCSSSPSQCRHSRCPTFFHPTKFLPTQCDFHVWRSCHPHAAHSFQQHKRSRRDRTYFFVPPNASVIIFARSPPSVLSCST